MMMTPGAVNQSKATGGQITMDRTISFSEPSAKAATIKAMECKQRAMAIKGEATKGTLEAHPIAGLLHLDKTPRGK